MKAQQEQRVAGRMLAMREHGPAIWTMMWGAKRRYVLLSVVLTLVAWGAWESPVYRPAALLLAGMTLGALLRDVGWAWAIKRQWPFSEKVTDWEKVEKIAAGE